MAEYSDLSFKKASKLLKKYGHELVSLTRIQGGMSNSSFKAETTDGLYVITILNNHQDSSFPTLLIELPNYLNSYGINVDEVLLTLDGDIRSVKSIPVIVKRYIEGETPRSDDLTSMLLLVNEMSKLHQLPVLEPLSEIRRRLPTDWFSLVSEAPPESLASLKKYMNQAETLFLESELNSHVQAICHGDLFPDNIIMSDSGDVYMIDWETAAYDSVYIDLGVMLVGWWDTVQTNGLTATLEKVAEAYNTYSMSPISVGELMKAAYYGAAVLMFHRFYRHNVRMPNHQFSDFYLSLAPMMDSLWNSMEQTETGIIRIPLLPS